MVKLLVLNLFHVIQGIFTLIMQRANSVTFWYVISPSFLMIHKDQFIDLLKF